MALIVNMFQDLVRLDRRNVPTSGCVGPFRPSEKMLKRKGPTRTDLKIIWATKTNEKSLHLLIFSSPMRNRTQERTFVANPFARARRSRLNEVVQKFPLSRDLYHYWPKCAHKINGGSWIGGA